MIPPKQAADATRHTSGLDIFGLALFQVSRVVSYYVAGLRISSVIRSHSNAECGVDQFRIPHSACYSRLSAIIGSTLTALSAGTKQAPRATAASTTDMPMKVAGSVGLT